MFRRLVHAAKPEASDVVLVIEVSSPSTEREDLVDKMAQYSAAGIPAYLVIRISESCRPSARSFRAQYAGGLTATIRRYRDSDRAAVYDICVETANAGRGVRGRYSTDDLVPDIFAGPYLFLEPEHAYVLDNGERAVGYVIGTASTLDFVAAYQERWLPRLRARYQPLSGPPVTEEEHRLDAMFHPERWLLPELAPHPAHLHINLLDGYRGSGHGRELMNTFLASVAAAGVGSCYLAVRPANVNARRFYAKLGWRPVEVRGAEPGTYLVHPTS